MAYDAALPHLFQTVPNQRVLVGVKLDVVGDRLVDEIAAGPVLCGGQRIKGVDLFGDGAEADGFLGDAHNTIIITCIISYYNTYSSARLRGDSLSSAVACGDVHFAKSASSGTPPPWTGGTPVTTRAQ